MLEESKVAASLEVPITLISTLATSPIPAGPGNFLTLVSSSIQNFVIVPISFLRFLTRGLYCPLNLLSGPSPTEVALTSWFEIGSSSATIPIPVSEASTVFARFE